LRAESRYYRAALQLYYNVTQIYPEADIWVVGHSLGGSISSLLGQTYGLPVVAFEAPGEALASDRLSLPLPPGSMQRQTTDVPIYHFGHTADPVFMGTCNGPTSVCALGGYAMETRCHAGAECLYDTVTDKGWRSGMGYHRILGVIKDVIEEYPEVPQCKAEPCDADCWNWKYVNGDEPTTTTTTTPPITTTTTTCSTPGWWGCRDPTTTTTTATSTSTTTSCTSYGWFGNCLDPTSTATSEPVTTTPVTTTATATTTASIDPTPCSHYGWFGNCLDPTSTSATSSATTSCAHPGRLWGCRDSTTSHVTPTPRAHDL